MFSAAQTLTGIDLDTYNLNPALNEEVIVIAIVACMPNTGVVSRDITHFTATNRRRRFLRTDSEVVTVTNAHTEASAQIDISYIVQFYNPSLNFAQVAGLLSKNIKDGTFDQALSIAALQYGASDLVGVTSSSIKVVNLFPADNAQILSMGGIAGIVIAGVFVLSLVVACVYWFVYMDKKVSDVSETFSKLFGAQSKGEKETDKKTETDKEKEKENEGKESEMESGQSKKDKETANKKPAAASVSVRKSLSPVRRKSASDANANVSMSESERDGVVTTENVFRDRLKVMRRKETHGRGGDHNTEEGKKGKKSGKGQADADNEVVFEMTDMSAMKKKKREKEREKEKERETESERERETESKTSKGRESDSSSRRKKIEVDEGDGEDIVV
jgi:hypothetical protein